MALEPELQSAVERLTALGYTVLRPVAAIIPETTAGQRWVSPSPKVKARTVVRLGAHYHWPWAEDKCVFFRQDGDAEADPLHKMNPKAWGAWVKKSGARPIASS